MEPLTYTATAASGASAPVEMHLTPQYLGSVYVLEARVAGRRADLTVDKVAGPVVRLTAEQVKLALGTTVKPGTYAVRLDRPYADENQAYLARANAALQAEAQALLAGLPPTTLVHPHRYVGGFGESVTVRVEGVEPGSSLAARQVTEQLAKRAQKLPLVFSLDEGREAAYSAPALTLGELLASCEAVEAAARHREEQAQAQRQRVAREELLVWDEDELYSSAGNQLLHALGARFSRTEGFVSIYTTGQARDIPKARTTYDLRGELTGAGVLFDQASKEWRLPYSLDNVQRVLALLRQHDTKAWPADLGMARCWECGRYSRRLDRDGYCGC